jgi:hypothetical protein
MELGGDEKRIQALFSELSFADQSRVPQFAHLWTRAQAIQVSALRRAVASPREKTFIRPMAILVPVLVIAVVCSLALLTWSRFTPSPNPNIVNYVVPDTPNPVKPVLERVEPRRQKHITRRRQVDRSLATEAALLSSWQSPTQQFMASPTVLGFSSLPQLNQSVKDLESFLSKNSEIMKESNR